MKRKIKVEVNGQTMRVVVEEARLSGSPDHETSWQAADVDISLEIDSLSRALSALTIRAGAYLDGTTDDRVWCQAQDGARALVSLLLGEPQQPSAYYAAPAVCAVGLACDDIGAAIAAAIREAAEEHAAPNDADEVTLVNPWSGAEIPSDWRHVREHAEQYVHESARAEWLEAAREAVRDGDWATLGKMVIGG